jgi:hypothetical protein
MVSTQMTTEMTMREWVQYGLDHGYAETFCYFHDSAPMEQWEAKEYYEDGGDPCIPTLRVWLDREEDDLPSSLPPNTQQQTLFE